MHLLWFVAFFYRIRNWSLFSEQLSVQCLQFKEKLQSRAEPSLACWFLQINASHSKTSQCAIVNTFIYVYFFPLSSLLVHHHHLCLPVVSIPPPPSLNFSESLHPGLQPLWTTGLDSWLKQLLAISFLAHLHLGKFFHSVVSLFLNRSLCYLCVTIQQKSMLSVQWYFFDVGRCLDLSAAVSRIRPLWEKLSFAYLDFASNGLRKLLFSASASVVLSVFLCFLLLHLPPLPSADDTSVHLHCLRMNPMCHLCYNGLAWIVSCPSADNML